jgi:hypothetical protein
MVTNLGVRHLWNITAAVREPAVVVMTMAEKVAADSMLEKVAADGNDGKGGGRWHIGGDAGS